MSCDPKSTSQPSCEESPGPGLLGWLLLLVGGFAYSMVGMFVVALVVIMLFESGGGLAQLADGKVSLLEGLPGMPNLVKASPDGSLWVRTMYRGSISRRSDGHWQVFQGPQWNTKSNYPFCGFALDGAEVWTAVDGKLLRYDGRQWQTVAHVPLQEELDGIAARNGHVWILAGQQLAVFDGRQWQQHDLIDPLAGLPSRSDVRWQDVSLAATEDGSLWLAVGGLWRLRNGRWSTVSIAQRRTVSPRIVGTEGGRLWVADGRSLGWISPDEQGQGSISYDTIGLSREEQVDSVIRNNGRWVISTGARILQQQGDTWSPLYSESQTQGRFGSFQHLVQASGRIYALVRKPYPLGPLVAISMITVTLAVLIIGGLYLYLPPPNQGQVKRQRALLVPLAVIIVVTMAPLLWHPGAPAYHGTFVGLVCLSLMAVFAPCLFINMRAVPVVFSTVTGKLFGQSERYRFDPVTGTELPRAAASYFDAQQPALEAIGFRCIGQYRHKRNSQQFGRHFYYDQMGIFASLEWSCILFFPVTNCCFLSLLDDGTYLETGNTTAGKSARADRFQTRVYSRMRPEELLERHLQDVAELEQEHGARALHLRQQSLESLSLYGLRLCYERMVERGAAPSNPYAQIDPMDLIRDIARDDRDPDADDLEQVAAANVAGE